MLAMTWVLAIVGGLLACLLLAMESLGRELPDWLPFRNYLWWLSILVFLASVLAIMFSNI